MSKTITFYFQSRNNNETLTPSVIVYNKAGVIQESGSATHSAEGKYVYDFTTSTTGSYYASFTAENRVVVTDIQSVTISSTASTGETTVTGYYVSTLQFNQFLDMATRVPDWNPASSPSYENVGTGDDSTSVFYLDQRNVISGSLTLYYGASASSVTALTETTHYSIDLDTGKITLTATGITLISTNNIYAEYQYNSNGLKDSVLRNFLDRAQVEIDSKLNTHFANDNDSTPDYKWVNQELHRGKGCYRRDYYTLKYPVVEVTTNLDGAIVTTTTTITVNSTSGFATTSTLTIGTEQISYVGKTDTTFTNCTRGANSSTAATHSDDAEVVWMVVEKSLSDEGSTPSWDTLQKDTGYAMQPKSGQFHLLTVGIGNTASTTNLVNLPIKNVPNRVRISYPYGYSEIPEDIQRVNLMMAARDLIHRTVSRAMIEGKNEFNPSLVDVDKDYIEETLTRYRSISMEYI